MSWEASKEALWVAFGLAGALNLVEAIFDPNGWLWTGLRILASTLFTIALVLWAIAFVRKRRSDSRPHSA